LLVTLLPSNTPAVTFAPEESVKVVAIVVIGGLGAFVGPVLGALWVVGVPAIWPDEPIVPFLVSGIGILVILLFAPGGLAGVLRRAEAWLLDRRRTHAAPPPSRTGVATPEHVGSGDARSAEVDRDWLVVRDVVVRFGGRVAVDHVDLRVGARELVGLIG